MNDIPEKQSNPSMVLKRETSSTSSLKDFENHVSKAFGLDSIVATSGDAKDQDLMATYAVKTFESDNQMPGHLKSYNDDAPPCTPGPSGTARQESMFPKTNNVPNNNTRPLASFTDLNDWVTKQFPIENQDMEPIYLAEESSLKGKEPAMWRRKEVMDQYRFEQIRRGYIRYSSGRHMEKRFQEEKLRRYLGYDVVIPRSWYAAVESGFHLSEDEYDFRKDFQSSRAFESRQDFESRREFKTRRDYEARRDTVSRRPNMKSGDYDNR
jgi:hypothetical protein